MIPLGFEIGTGEPVEIPVGHTAVIGQTQESGKTTTLEGLAARSKLRTLAFVTKRGESSFRVRNPISPYFRQQITWQNVGPLVETIIDAKLDNYQGMAVMRLCRADGIKVGKNNAVSWKAPENYADLLANAKLAAQHARGMQEFIFTQVEAYLSTVVPEIARLPYVERLELARGLNVIELGEYHHALQALVVRDCTRWIQEHGERTVLVIPEAWKFASKLKRTPVRIAAEEFIREGAALRNFIWLDSQDLASVAEPLLRQIRIYLFGKQMSKREISRNLEYLPADVRVPAASEIRLLEKGQFIACWDRDLYKVYVQPAWMSPSHAQAIALGEEDVDSAKEIALQYDQEHAE